MNSGTSSTELNDMLTNFANYVDSFYGVNDPLYPMDRKPWINSLLANQFTMTEISNGTAWKAVNDTHS